MRNSGSRKGHVCGKRSAKNVPKGPDARTMEQVCGPEHVRDILHYNPMGLGTANPHARDLFRRKIENLTVAGHVNTSNAVRDGQVRLRLGHVSLPPHYNSYGRGRKRPPKKKSLVGFSPCTEMFGMRTLPSKFKPLDHTFSL